MDSLPEEQRALLRDLEKRDYHSFILPPITTCLYSWFPFTTTFSVILAVNRVYPALSSELQEKRLEGGPAIEIYTSDRIYFLIPLENQTAFFVPECGPSANTPAASASESPQPVEKSVAPLPVPVGPGDENNNENNNKSAQSTDQSASTEQVINPKCSLQPEPTRQSAATEIAACSSEAAQAVASAPEVEGVCSSAATTAAPHAGAAADGEESDVSSAEAEGGGSRVGDEAEVETENTDADSSNATASSFEQVDRDEDSSARASPTHSPPAEMAREGDS